MALINRTGVPQSTFRVRLNPLTHTLVKRDDVHPHWERNADLGVSFDELANPRT
jgi:hypothetical protein